MFNTAMFYTVNHHLCRFVCSNWLQGSSVFVVIAQLEMVSREPAACDDPRNMNSYPCFGNHKSGKMRTNQYASWMTCARCGVRLQYTSKGASHGQDRQFQVVPHLLQATLDDLQKTVEPSQCSEQLVNGKMMELKGQMLQVGVTNTMAMHLTYAQYQERLSKAYPKTSPKATAPPPSPKAAAPPSKTETAATASAEAPMIDTLEAENQALKERLAAAEMSAKEAIERTELLAKEALRQKEEAARQADEMSKMKAAQAKKDEKEIPQAVSSGEEEEEKKRKKTPNGSA